MGCVTSTQLVKAAIPEQPARQLDQPEVVAILLVVTDQDAAALRQPGERPLHHPPTRLVALRSVTPPGLLADPPDVRRIARVGRRRPTVGVVVALVQAQVLLPLGRVGALDD